MTLVRMKYISISTILIFILSACGGPTYQVIPNTPSPSREVFPTTTREMGITSVLGTSTFSPQPLPETWQSWPIIPNTFIIGIREIYDRGQVLGNDPKAYSKIGDCDATPTWFLGVFDGSAENYSLGDYVYLQDTIDNFRGSHSRISLATGNGYSSANILATFMADPDSCERDETPLACEIRIHRPSFALVSLGSNDIFHQETFVINMRQIIDTLIEGGVIPILASKADNLEGDNNINLEIARLAYEYGIPFWNFWLAVQPLPSHGLQADGAHLTWAGPFFDDPVRMQAAWPWRNLTAIQTLDAVWRWVTFVP